MRKPLLTLDYRSKSSLGCLQGQDADQKNVSNTSVFALGGFCQETRDGSHRKGRLGLGLFGCHGSLLGAGLDSVGNYEIKASANPCLAGWMCFVGTIVQVRLRLRTALCFGPAWFNRRLRPGSCCQHLMKDDALPVLQRPSAQ